MDDRSKEDSLRNRLETHIASLEFSNSELNKLILAQKTNLDTSNSMYQHLQAQYGNLSEKNEENESKKKLLDMFYELRLQEKEIFIKNIELLLLRVEKQESTDCELFHQLETQRAQSIIKNTMYEECVLENQQLKQQLFENLQLIEKDRRMLKEEFKNYEKEIMKEREKTLEIQKQNSFHLKQVEEIKKASKEAQEENALLKKKLFVAEEQNREMQTLIVEKKRENEYLRTYYEEMVRKFQEELKPWIMNVQTLQTNEENRVLLLENVQKELSEVKIQKTKIEEELREKEELYKEENERHQKEDLMLKTISFLTLKDFKDFDLNEVLRNLQRGYIIEKTRALNLHQTVNNLKKALSTKFESLYQKFEEWKDFMKKFQEIKLGYDLQNKKIKDLSEERERSDYSIKELIKTNKKLKKEKKELLTALGRLCEENDGSATKGDFFKEIIEKNVAFQSRLEQIYQENYLKL